MQRLGAAGHGSRQQILGNGDEVASRSGLDLKVALDLAGQPQHRGGFEFDDGAAQGGGAAAGLDHEQMRAPDMILLDDPVTGGEPAGKALRMQGRTRLLDKAGRPESGHRAMDLRQSVAHIRMRSAE